MGACSRISLVELQNDGPLPNHYSPIIKHESGSFKSCDLPLKRVLLRRDTIRIVGPATRERERLSKSRKRQDLSVTAFL